MKHQGLWILAGLGLLLLCLLVALPARGIEKPGVTYTGTVLDAQKNVLDPHPALKIELRAGMHQLALKGGEITYGKSTEASTALAVRAYDNTTQESRLYRLAMMGEKSMVLPIELGKAGGFVQLFIVDDWARDNRGTMTVEVDGKTHLFDPRAHVLDLRKAAKLTAPAGETMGITQLTFEDLRYAKGGPLAEECLARVRYLHGGRVEYVVLSPEHLDFPFEAAEVALFLVDETPKDNTGHVRINFRYPI